FGLIPIVKDDQFAGTYLVELKNKSFRQLSSYPDALLSGDRPDVNSTVNLTSFAFYLNGELISQQGEYLFPKTDENFPQEVNTYLRVPGENHSELLWYRPDARRLLIMSSKGESWWMQLASLSFLFLVFLVFSIFIYTVRWIRKNVNDYEFNFRNI